MRDSDRCYLSQSIWIPQTDERWADLDHASWLSKNIYNVTTYIIRQAFFADRRAGIEHDPSQRTWERCLDYSFLYKRVRDAYTQDYRALPKRVANETVKLVIQDWTSFKNAHDDWLAHPHKYLGEPKPPRYKPTKEKGRCSAKWEKEAVHKGFLRKTGKLRLSQCEIVLEVADYIHDTIREVEGLDETSQINFYDYLVEVRLSPRVGGYQIEIVYAVTPKTNDKLNPEQVAAIDLGINNLMAITSNNAGFQPILVNGRPLKSINHYFNQRRAHLQSQLPQGQFTSRRILALTRKRNRKVKDYLHRAAKLVIKTLLENGIGTLVIGKNDNWKQRSTLGKRNNQSFLSIPHSRLIEMLKYKAQLVGIEVLVVTESYTSKCSFLDGEAPQKQATYVGQRVKRGLFRTQTGQYINADVNASYNILLKALPNAFAEGIQDVTVHPILALPA
ncbi:MAG: transposase [Chloroflexota bacterium]